jgi:hypothetical protein
MKRWRSQSDSRRLSASMEYESALAGSAAGPAGPYHLSRPVRRVQCAGVGGKDRIPLWYGDPQAALQATAALLGGYDLVQAHPEPIGGTVDAIRAALSWLGKCSREQAGHSMHLVFKFTPEIDAQATLKLKVEINTREHATLLGVRRYPFAVENDWYRGTAEIASFEPEELFGTKLRALLQRRRNRDLFDLHQGIEQLPLDPEKVIACFDHYLSLEGKPITRAMAEQRMLEKLTRSLTEDVAPMLPASVRWSDADAIQAFERVWTELIARIGGDRWKLSDAVIEELRAKRYPALLMPRDGKQPQ